ncbi:hypothetical protein CspHIS471_0303470 [Cutaneotrichosporon sp. HIS471]|nr:hypothetical protein CspHIS471_0303470 [Cutaneotrichosporon sp. HIS471]
MVARQTPTCHDDQVLYWSVDASAPICGPIAPLCQAGWYWCTDKCIPYWDKCDIPSDPAKPLPTDLIARSPEPEFNANPSITPKARAADSTRNSKRQIRTCGDTEVLQWRDGAPVCAPAPPICQSGWYWCTDKCVPYWTKCESAVMRRDNDKRNVAEEPEYHQAREA